MSKQNIIDQCAEVRSRWDLLKADIITPSNPSTRNVLITNFEAAMQGGAITLKEHFDDSGDTVQTYSGGSGCTPLFGYSHS